MKIFRKVLAICLLIFVISFGVCLIKVSAEDNTISNQQIEQIRNTCDSTKVTLNQLHTSDALLRVNMGQMYESMLTKLMNKFNGRTEYNGYNNSNLVAVSKNYEKTLDSFRSDYIRYEQQLSLTIGIDCSKQPVAFYDAISLVRNKRKQVNVDVLKLDQYIDQYQSAVNEFEKTYQGAKEQ